MSVMHSKPLVIVLLGPTASRKTVLSLDIAERLSLPIINIDSRQLYIGMNIGTAIPYLILAIFLAIVLTSCSENGHCG